jgi:hypothetical protein
MAVGFVLAPCTVRSTCMSDLWVQSGSSGGPNWFEHIQKYGNQGHSGIDPSSRSSQVCQHARRSSQHDNVLVSCPVANRGGEGTGLLLAGQHCGLPGMSHANSRCNIKFTCTVSCPIQYEYTTDHPIQVNNLTVTGGSGPYRAFFVYVRA